MGDDLEAIAAARKGMTFAQAEGAAPLPTQLQLREISPECAATLWALVYESMVSGITDASRYRGASSLDGKWHRALTAWWISQEHGNIDEFPDAYSWVSRIKAILTSRNYIKTFHFLQFVMSSYGLRLDTAINNILVHTRSAYRVVDGVICPISTDEEALAVRRALAEAARAAAQGPLAHLKAASRALSKGDWPGTVRESISAVEGAAKSIEPDASALGDALARLQDTIGLKPALKKAYSALYGWSSDEKGIRHAKVFEGEADVSERDAIFMFGACASFVSYLLSAQREMARQ